MEFDCIVIGAGSTGCAIAARLSEDPSVRVALVEARNTHAANVMIGDRAATFIRQSATSQR